MLTISAVPDSTGATVHYIALFSDISQLKEHQHQLEQIAHFDALTGLPNRVLLTDRMQQTLRESDTLARLGGDEFVAIFLVLSDNETCLPLLRRLPLASAQEVNAQGISMQVSTSLGVTFYPQSESIEADQLLRQADHAMYQAKQAGKNRYQLFDAAWDPAMRGH